MNETQTSGPALAQSTKAADSETVAALWDHLAKTDPKMFAALWPKAIRTS